MLDSRQRPLSCACDPGSSFLSRVRLSDAAEPACDRASDRQAVIKAYDAHVQTPADRRQFEPKHSQLVALRDQAVSQLKREQLQTQLSQQEQRTQVNHQ